MHTTRARLGLYALTALAVAGCAHAEAPRTTHRTIAAPSYVASRECGDVSLPESLDTGSQALVLNGMAIKRVTFLRIEVFVSGLYLEREMRDVDEVLTTPQSRRLVVRFVRHVSRAMLVRGLRWALDHNASEQDERTHAAEFSALLAALPSFSEGDELAFDQSAGSGFTVLVNGVPRARFASPEFARVCMLAFLGPNGNYGLRQGLVGGHCNR